MSNNQVLKPNISQDSNLKLIKRIRAQISFNNALNRIINPQKKIDRKQWHDTEWGFLYLTPEQYIKFLIKRAGDDY